MGKSVCAIIVTYCTGEDFLKCFDSIINQVDEVVIVDNGADPKTMTILTSIEKKYTTVKIFYNETNLGIASAINIGVKYAINKGYIWILTLDHDSEATPGMVEKLLDTYSILNKQHHNNIGIIAANPFDINTQKHLIDQNLFAKENDILEVDRVISSGSLICTSVFENVGFFNEQLFLYCVDDDFCLRCRNKNIKIYVNRSSVLFHKEGAKEIKKILWKKFYYDNYDPHAQYYISRNTIYMLRRYLKNHRYKNSYYIVRRIFKDMFKNLLYANNKMNMIFYTTKGLFDGIKGKYGKLNLNNNKSGTRV